MVFNVKQFKSDMNYVIKKLIKGFIYFMFCLPFSYVILYGVFLDASYVSEFVQRLLLFLINVTIMLISYILIMVIRDSINVIKDRWFK